MHTFLGRLAGTAISDPALATRVLSAVCTGAAVWILSAIILSLTGNGPAGIAAPLMFAFAPTVWNAAITTEVYNVNIFVVSAALALALRYRRRPSLRAAAAVGAALGVSLGSGMANALLLPGFALLIPGRWASRLKHAAVAACAMLATGGVVLSWTFFRSGTHPPLGSAQVPNTVLDFLLFLSGAQYSTLIVQPFEFYKSRAIEHSVYWGASFLWLGALLGLWGAWLQWRRQRALLAAFLVMLALNLGYFTCYPWIDYRDMVTPSYLVFAIWIGYGIRELDTLGARLGGRLATAAVPLAVVAGLLLSGVRREIHARGDSPVTDFARTSLDGFPPHAVVVAHWYEFTPLLYFQRTQGLRPDVTLLERSDRRRFYTWGEVEDWRRFVHAAVESRPVVTDDADSSLAGVCEFIPIGGPWYRMTPINRPPPGR